jgi:GntR family transcriptional regulator / MocR family aminotransferase
MSLHRPEEWERDDLVTDEKDLTDCGTARIEQLAFANFLSRGELDRHLRRMRAEYRRRRDRLVEAVEEVLPDAKVQGIAAGLHATVELPDEHDDRAILEETHARRIDLTAMGEFWIGPTGGPPDPPGRLRPDPRACDPHGRE